MDTIHLKSPQGWINDPNGFIYYKGEYHLFYQYFPYAPQWGRMHWGHAVSKDLTHWKHLGVALFPTKKDDADGCFSGSAIEKDGNMVICYTGVNYDEQNPENINCCLNDKFTASQLTISSPDGYTFDNFNKKYTIIPAIDDTNIGDRTHTRDPKIWQGADKNYYMILGSTTNNQGKLLFYSSSDLKEWKYINSTTESNLGWMWECPDYFRTSEKDVLIFSPMGLENGNQAVCTLVNFDEKDCNMKIDKNYQFFDYGLDLYAPQSTTDKDGNRVIISWLRMPEPINKNSIGMFSIPRVCKVKDNHIYFIPHDNIRRMFNQVANDTIFSEKTYMIKTTLDENQTINIGGFIIGRKNNQIFTDRSNVIRNHTELNLISKTPTIQNGELEIYVDKNIIEVFVNNGEYVITNAVYDLDNILSSDTEYKIFTLEDSNNEKI